MRFIGDVLVFIGLALLVYSIYKLIKSRKQKESKKQLIILIVGGFALMVIGSYMSPPPKEETQTKKQIPNTEKTPKKKDAEKKKETELATKNKENIQKEKEQKENEKKAKVEKEKATKQKKETEEIKLKEEQNTPENKIKKWAKKENIDLDYIRFDGSNLVIMFATKAMWSENTYVKGFPHDAAKMLSHLKSSEYENIIIGSAINMTDQKGNESQQVGISSMFTIENINSINFDNWTDDVGGRPEIFYNVADCYHFHPGIINKVTDSNLKVLDLNKSNQSEFWVNNGFAINKP